MERSAGGGGVTTNNQVELFRELEDSQHSTTSNKSTNQWKRSDVLEDRSKPTTNNQLSANNTGKPRQLSLVLSSGQGDSMRKRSSVKSVRESELILAALMGATTNVNISGKGTKNGPFSITGRSATTPIGSGKSGLFSGLGWNGSGKVAVSADSHSNASVTAGPCLTTEENPYNNNNDIEATRQPHDNQDHDNENSQENEDEGQDIVSVDLQAQRNPLHLLWLLVGVAIGLCFIKLAFATAQFGDPLDNTDPHQWYCAVVCSSLWCTLFSAVNCALIHELLIKRRVYGDLDLPPVPFLHLRYLLSPIVTGLPCFGAWVGLYYAYGTMIPFHGTMAAVFGALVQSFYFYQFLLPGAYFRLKPELIKEYIILAGSFGITVGSFIIPMLTYWIALIFYQLAIKQANLGWEIVTLLLFQVSKIALMHYEMYIFRVVLGPVSDSFSRILAISIVSILHNSFYATAVESSSSYLAVIMAILGNVLFAVHRSLQLLHNIDLVRFARTQWGKIINRPLRLTKRSNRDAVMGTAPSQISHSNRTAPSQIALSNRTALNQTTSSNRTAPNQTSSSNRAAPNQIAISNRTAPNQTSSSNRSAPNQTTQSNRTAPNQTNQSNHASDVPTEVSSIELEKQHHNHRVYLVLQFLSWEVYKVVIPLMYLASVYIIMNSSNRIWMGGLGRTAYQYSTNMNNPDDLINLTQKLLVLAGCDALILLTESWVLSTLKIDMFGLLCYSFKEYGHCFALLLAFLPLHNLCITVDKIREQLFQRCRRGNELIEPRPVKFPSQI